MISMDKKYRYREGGEAKVLCVDNGEHYPVVSINGIGGIATNDINGIIDWIYRPLKDDKDKQLENKR